MSRPAYDTPTLRARRAEFREARRERRAMAQERKAAARHAARIIK